jgi:hypothetical protein
MKRTLIHLLTALVGLALAGCAGSVEPSKKTSAWESGSLKEPAHTEALRRDLMNFADRFAGSMVEAYDELAARTPRADLKRLIIERKLISVASAYMNAVEPNPIVGLLDMLVMARLLREVSEDAWFSEMFTENASRIAIKLKAQEADIWNLAARYVTEAQLEELRDVIDKWRQAHPDERYVSMVRVSDFPQAQPSSAAKGPSSVFGLLFLDPLSGLDPAMREVTRSRELAERVLFYLQRMPMLLTWRIEALSDQSLHGPEIQQFLKNMSEFAAIATRFTKNAEAVTELVGKFPKQLSDERERTVEHVARKTTEERTAVVNQVAQAIAAERDAAIRQSADAIAKERDAALKQVAKAVSSEREAVAAALNVALQTQREAFVREAEAASGRMVNRIFIFACSAVSLGVLLAAAASLIVRRYVAQKRFSWSHRNELPFARISHDSERGQTRVKGPKGA